MVTEQYYLDQIGNDENLKVLKRYIRYLSRHDRSDLTIRDRLKILRDFENNMSKPFKAVTQEDVGAFLDHIKEKGLAKSTRRSYSVALKIFFKWLGKPKVTKDVPYKLKKNDLLPEDMLTPEEVKVMLENTVEVRDRAALTTLYDGGLRASEFLGLTIGAVRFDGPVTKLTIRKSKTIRREVPMIRATPYLQRWILDYHPDRENKDAPLWVSKARGGHGYQTRSIDHSALSRIVKKAAERAGLSKRVWPHLLRHSRATECARKGWNEAQMREMFGWARNSSMPSQYMHLASSDIEDRVLQDEGKREPKPEDGALSPQSCWRCHGSVEATSPFCGNCGSPMDIDEYEKQQAELVLKAATTDLLTRPEALREVLNEHEVKSMGLVSRGMKTPLVQLSMTPEMFEKFKKMFGDELRTVEAED